MNSRDTGSMSTTSDTSPPLKFSAAEESSPENRPSPMLTPHRLRSGQSTESLDSLSDLESARSPGGGGGGRRRSSNRNRSHNTPAGSGVNAQNPVARPRRVSKICSNSKTAATLKCVPIPNSSRCNNWMENFPI